MAAPAKALTHKERLLREGMRSFYASGFHGTTVDAILAASGVPKGSFYHHFGSKEAFGLAVLDRYMQLQLDALAKWADDETLSTTGKLTGYFAELTQAFVRSGFQRACLAGKFSTELAADSEPFRDRLGAALSGWHRALSELLHGGQKRGDVRDDRGVEELSHSVLAIIQGAFVIALSVRDTGVLDAVRDSFGPLIKPPSSHESPQYR